MAAPPQNVEKPKSSRKQGACARIDSDAGPAAAPAAKRRRDEKPQRALRRDERRQVMGEAKATWEALRPKAVDAEKTAKLVTTLCDLLGGRIAEFVFRHDGSRIVQWMLADASTEQKASIMDELLSATYESGTGEDSVPFFVRLACDRYGRHLAMKLLRVATKQHRAAIFERYLRGNTAALVRNSYGADVLDFAFQTVLNARHRADLVVELLFSRAKDMFEVVVAKSAGLKEKGDGSTQVTFEVALDLVGDSFKDVVVDSAGAVLSPLIDKDATVRLEIVHAALDDYLTVLMKHFPADKARLLCGQLAPSIVHLAHTKPGVSCAVNCIKILDAKHRKKAVRSLKGHVRALISEEYGHRLLIAMFEWVDDTKLVGKAVTAELFSSSKVAADMALLNDDDAADVEMEASTASGGSKKKAKKSKVQPPEVGGTSDDGILDLDFVESTCLHKHGRMLLLSMLFPRDSRYFNPDLYGHIWTDIDESKYGKMSKKDGESRRQELLSQFVDVIRRLVARSFRKLLMSHWSAPVLIGALSVPSLSIATTESAVKTLSGLVQGNDDQLAMSLCARKTIGTMVKIGGVDFRESLRSDLGSNAEAELRHKGWDSVSNVLSESRSGGNGIAASVDLTDSDALVSSTKRSKSADETCRTSTRQSMKRTVKNKYKV
jgi:hypothetical protein